jgi:signal transduction histidine kinase
LRQGQVRVLRGVDGVERVYAMGKAGSLGLYVVAGVAEEQVYGPVRQNALRSALAGLLVLLLAAAVVVRMTRRITRPMGALADTAEAVGRGELDRRAPEGGPAELGRVATQFNRMLDRLPAMERELRASEERHRVLVEKLARNVPGMIYILTLYPDGRAVMPFASEGVRTMFETTPEEAEADAGALQRRVHPEDAPAMLRAVEASRRTLGHFSAEYRVVLPQAGTRHYLTRSQPEQREDGAIVWYGCTVDITGLKLAEHALAQLNAELEQRVAQRTRELALANEALASFSYSAAHDMRAPLVAINGFAGALRAALKAGQPERGIHLVDRIAANGTHMTEMLDGLLALGRVSRGAAEDRPQDLAVIVGELVGELAVPPGVRIEVAPLPMVLGDRALLRQAFWNLLSNAAKFTAPRGEAGHVRVGWHASGDEVVFEVRDNGVGFDPARAGRMFEAFQRMHAESEFHGTGVGLSIVRRVAERHGGRVWADSQPGEGSVFHLALPRDRLIGTGEGAA